MIVQNSLGRDRVDDIVVFACDGKLSVDVILAACVVAVTFVDFVVVAWVDSVAGVSCTVLSLTSAYPFHPHRTPVDIKDKHRLLRAKASK